MGGGGGGILGSIGGAAEDRFGIDLGFESSSDKAMDAQQRASDKANNLQYHMYQTQRQDLAPWRDAGSRAITGMEDAGFQKDFTLADFQADPGYQFRMQEGMKAINNAASARGMGNSGATLKALSKYGQDFASTEFGNAYNRFNADRDRRFGRLSQLANMGQNSAAGQAAAASNYGNNVSQNYLNMGQSEASKYMGDAARMNKYLDSREEMAGKALGGMMSFSDERLKENITPLTSEEIKELKQAIRPYKYNYKDEAHGEGDWIGVMAQDLEKTKFGRFIVTEDSQGRKQIDIRKAVSLLLASMAEV